MEDKGLAPGLNRSTFQRISDMIEEILERESINDPREMAVLAHGLVLAEWFLSNSDRLTDPFKTSEEILRRMHFTEEEIVAINVFFRKKRDALKILKERMEKKLAKESKPHGRKEGVKIDA